MTDEDALRSARARAGLAIREMGHAFIGRHATLDQIEQLTATVEALTDQISQQERRSRDAHEFADSKKADLPQGAFESDSDDRPISGRSSPWGLDLDLARHGDEIEAVVTLGAAHEGAPNRAHGGVVSALFDDVFGFILTIVHEPAFTGDLYIRYAAPTPLFRQLACRVRLADREGRKMMLTGELVDVESGTVTATATATFISVDPEAFSQAAAEQPTVAGVGK